jgi:hypothetical protein
MVEAFNTYRAEEKSMQQRNVKEQRNLEENDVEMGNNSTGEHELDVSGSGSSHVVGNCKHAA